MSVHYSMRILRAREEEARKKALLAEKDERVVIDEIKADEVVEDKPIVVDDVVSDSKDCVAKNAAEALVVEDVVEVDEKPKRGRKAKSITEE